MSIGTLVRTLRRCATFHAAAAGMARPFLNAGRQHAGGLKFGLEAAPRQLPSDPNKALHPGVDAGRESDSVEVVELL